PRIGAALKVAVAACDPQGVNRPVLVLLSDGDDPATDEEWLEGVTAAKAKNYRVHAVGIGDPNRPEKIPSGKEWLGYEGEPGRTRLNEKVLQEISRRTDGIYVPAQTKELPLGSIVQHLLDANELREDPASDSALSIHQLRYAWFLLPALALLLLSMLLQEGPRPLKEMRPPLAGAKVPTTLLAFVALLGISAANPPDVSTLIGQGNEAFARQE